MIAFAFFSPVSGVASVAKRGGFDSHCSDWNRENLGLPAARVHPHGWTACVSAGPVQPVGTFNLLL